MRAAFPAELVVYESAVDSLWQMGGMGQYIYVHVVDAEQAVAEGAGALPASLPLPAAASRCNLQAVADALRTTEHCGQRSAAFQVQQRVEGGVVRARLPSGDPPRSVCSAMVTKLAIMLLHIPLVCKTRSPRHHRRLQHPKGEIIGMFEG